MGEAFRTLDELAVRCGHYCWTEHALFALTGQWAGAPTGTGEESELRVACNAMSSWHGFVAGQWRDRLPVRAGVDAGALVVPPPGPLAPALDLLAAEAATDLAGALRGLAEQILPALLVAYDTHLAQASPVSEAPVRAVLDLVRPRLVIEIEIEGARELLGPAAGGDGDPRGSAEKRAETGARLQRVLGAQSDIFPAARAS